jgi:hypothetical protein
MMIANMATATTTKMCVCVVSVDSYVPSQIVFKKLNTVTALFSREFYLYCTTVVGINYLLEC